MTALLAALIAALLLAMAGLACGVVTRRLLARLRRGAQVPPP
jgi:NhaP-type Na+/H+ or K+/H+ antiporter